MKNFFRVLLALLLICAVIIFPSKLYAKLNTDIITDEILARRERYYYGSITVWQIDCFEGGRGSRAGWLKEQSKAFEKKHNGVYISVEAISPQRANILLKQKKPDIISFSSGIIVENTQVLDIDLSQIRNDLSCANFEDAVPWCFGIYCLFEGEDNQKEDKIVYSNKEGFYPLNALNEIVALSEKERVFMPLQYEAFNAYINKKYSSLLGTQRDLYRLSSAKTQRLGTISILNYSDLIHYFSAYKCEDEKKSDMIKKYISFILSTEIQNNLGKIGLFPANISSDPEYDNVFVAELWQQIKENEFNFVSTVKKH